MKGSRIIRGLASHVPLAVIAVGALAMSGLVPAASAAARPVPSGLGGQNWTVHRYGGAGAEIIFVLDGADGPGTCAQQASGTVDIKAGLEWLVSNGFESGPIVLSQINTGWEITQADNATFTVHSYSITAN